MANKDLELGSRDAEMMPLLAHHVKNVASLKDRPPLVTVLVPSVLRDQSPHSFNPQLVSIGPLHREVVKLQAFEKQKPRYMVKLMSRIKNCSQEEIWKTCMEKAYTLMKNINAFYVWPRNKNYTDAKVAEMMVIDACFILELTYQLNSGMVPTHFDNKLQFKSLMKDLLLIENQIPLFFLNEIYQCTILKFRSDVSLIQLISNVLRYNIIFPEAPKINMDNDPLRTAPHILGILHQCFMPPDNIKEVSSGGSRIHSATNLDIAGVKVIPSQNPTWVMGIEMKQYKIPFSPTIAMPVLRIHNSTESVLRNLIAYEHANTTRSYVTSYVDAVDMLVNTQEDVAKLIDSGVLINLMGSNEEVANMINSLRRNVVAPTFYEEEWNKVNKHCNDSCQKHIAIIKRTYFRSPWTSIALLALIILFFSDGIQAIIAIMSYVSSKK